jgi:hypothetical protein
MAFFEFIEGWYDPNRRRSALDCLSPINYGRSHQLKTLPQAQHRLANPGNSSSSRSSRQDGAGRCSFAPDYRRMLARPSSIGPSLRG